MSRCLAHPKQTLLALDRLCLSCGDGHGEDFSCLKGVFVVIWCGT